MPVPMDCPHDSQILAQLNATFYAFVIYTHVHIPGGPKKMYIFQHTISLEPFNPGKPEFPISNLMHVFYSFMFQRKDNNRI